jgi:hypothetical protein
MIELAAPRVDPTYLIVMAWIVCAVGVAMWYLLSTRQR